MASEPRERSAPAQRRARARVGESERRSPSDKIRLRRHFDHVVATEWLVVVAKRDLAPRKYSEAGRRAKDGR